jgi:hypothetical protein
MFPEKRTDRTLNFYAHAFSFHARMNDFLVDFGERRGWTLLANILRIRYSNAFTAFLDRPTLSRLAGVLSFDNEMMTVCAKLPPVRPGYEQRRPDQR